MTETEELRTVLLMCEAALCRFAEVKPREHNPLLLWRLRRIIQESPYARDTSQTCALTGVADAGADSAAIASACDAIGHK